MNDNDVREYLLDCGAEAAEGEAVALAPHESVLIERVPPHSLSAEMAVVGSLFLAHGWTGCERIVAGVKGLVSARDFYRTAHARVFSVLMELAEDGKPPDPLLVIEQLKARGHMDDGTLTPDAIASMSACVQSPAHAEHYARLVRDASLRRQVLSLSTRVQASVWDYAVRPSGLAAQLREAADQVDTGLASVIEGWAGEYIDDVHKKLLHPPRLETSDEVLSWNIRELDQIGFVVEPGSFTVVAAWTGNGKSTFVNQWAWKTASRIGRPILYCSLEMPPEQLVRKAILNDSGVDDPNFKQLAEHDGILIRDSVDYLREARVLMPRRIPRQLDRFLEWLYGVQAQIKPAATIIDHIGLLQGPGRSIYERVTEISRQLRTFSLNEQMVPLIGLCQLNRDSKKYGKEPNLQDLRDSGAIEEDASNVLMMYYPWACTSKKKRNDGSVPKDQAWLFVRKNRNGDNHRKVEIAFDGAKSRILAVERREPDEDEQAPSGGQETRKDLFS